MISSFVPVAGPWSLRGEKGLAILVTHERDASLPNGFHLLVKLRALLRGEGLADGSPRERSLEWMGLRLARADR